MAELTAEENQKVKKKDKTNEKKDEKKKKNRGWKKRRARRRRLSREGVPSSHSTMSWTSGVGKQFVLEAHVGILEPL